MVYLKQQLRAVNDSNGNPRRVWVLYAAAAGDDFAGVLSTLDEGYGGEPRHGDWGNAARLRTVDVSVSEYKRFRDRDNMR